MDEIIKQQEAASLIVGKRVTYSITKDTFSTGLVLDKLDMREKATDEFTITGYLIQDDNGSVQPVAHWRIKKINTSQQGYLRGGYNRHTHSEA